MHEICISSSQMLAQHGGEVSMKFCPCLRSYWTAIGAAGRRRVKKLKVMTSVDLLCSRRSYI